MPNETCILTTKDFTILEGMRDRCLGRGDLLAPVLNRKIESAVVTFRNDVPENVATLSSRVTFTVNGRDRDTRVISHDRMTSPISMFLPITTLRGLALLGLSEGQEFVVTNIDGAEERITLERVHYQPEAVKRKEAIKREPAGQQQTPLLEVTRRAFYDQPLLVPIAPIDPSPPAASQPPRMMSVATLVATEIGKWFQAMLMMLAATSRRVHRCAYAALTLPQASSGPLSSESA